MLDNAVSTRPSDDGPQADQSGAPGNSMRPSELEKGEALRTFKAWFKGDASHSKEWRSNAKDDFDFVAGDQWSEVDQGILKDQKRTPIVFNRTLTIIKAVAGMEINGRHEIAYLPRKLEDSAVDETLSGASKWMADECDGEDEESESFQHTLICGIGVLEHRLDYEEEADGKYIEEAIDPLEYYWDRTAKKKNMVDRRRDWRVRVMPLGDAQQLFPGFDRDQLDAKWAYGSEPNRPQKTLEEKRIRDENSSGPLADQDEVTLVHVEWWEREECWCVADPASNKMLRLDKPTYEKLKERHAEVQAMMAQAIPGFKPEKLTAAKTYRKVFKRAFLGSEVLEIGPTPDPSRFSRTVITGEHHHNKRTWFGIIRTLRDPQMWGNKWLSQVLHILNSTAKGGILAETDAFDDQRQAEERYAQPQGIVWMKKGALSGQNGSKVMEKPGAGKFEGHMELLTLAINATRDVSGINLELLGQKDVNQPGILEAMRKQAGMTVLATMFDALRRMRKLVGRIRLFYIQNYLSDGRIIRIVGQDGAKTIRLLREKCLGEYDVIVDDTPTSPNQKQANWAIISGLLPAFKDQLMAKPEILIKVLRYSPLPEKLVDDIDNAMQAPPGPKTPDQQQHDQLMIAGAVAKITKDQAQAELFQKQAGATEATSMYDLAMAQNLLIKHQGDMAAAFNEARKSGMEAAKTAAETGNITAKTDTERANADSIRAKTAGQHADTRATHVGALIDALTPIPHSDSEAGGPAMPAPHPVAAQ
jgi:hypothetical protein